MTCANAFIRPVHLLPRTPTRPQDSWRDTAARNLYTIAGRDVGSSRDARFVCTIFSLLLMFSVLKRSARNILEGALLYLSRLQGGLFRVRHKRVLVADRLHAPAGTSAGTCCWSCCSYLLLHCLLHRARRPRSSRGQPRRSRKHHHIQQHPSSSQGVYMASSVRWLLP